jgi:hypothetical protein
VSEPLNRSTFPRAPEEVLLPTVETVELEQEQTLEAWANAHPHETVAVQTVYDDRTIPARYCPSCRKLKTLPRVPIICRYLEQAHLENLAGCRGPANGRTTLGGLGTLTNGVPSPSALLESSLEGTL